MVERVQLSKKQRFGVFKRDLFTCQYCGSTPPGAILEVDHIHPVAQGGGNGIDNLITACFDCNRGKGASLLSSVPESVSDRMAIVAEKMEQLKAYEKLIKAKRKHEEKQIDDVQSVFQLHFSGYEFNSKFRESVRGFLQTLPVHILEECMHKACSRIKRHDDAIKYFCGICWNVIKEQANG